MVLIRFGADKVWYSKYEYRRKNKGTNQVWYLKLRCVELRPKKLPKMFPCTLKLMPNTIEMMNKKGTDQVWYLSSAFAKTLCSFVASTVTKSSYTLK